MCIRDSLHGLGPGHGARGGGHSSPGCVDQCVGVAVGDGVAAGTVAAAPPGSAAGGKESVLKLAEE